MASVAAVFLDRDGTIIVDQHYPKDPNAVSFLPKVPEALRLLKEKGFLLFVVSNQSGVGRGLISDSEFKSVHDAFVELLKAEGVEISGFFYCLHHPDDPCHCRKPKTGNIPKRFDGKPIDFLTSYTVGDRLSDLQLGDELGAKACLVLTGKGIETQREIEENGNPRQYVIYENLYDLAQELPTVTQG